MVFNKNAYMRTKYLMFIMLCNMLLHSCINYEPKVNNAISEGHQSDNTKDIGLIEIGDTLKIISHFSECGEWGGHKEFIEIFRNNTFQLGTHYIIDTVSCEQVSNGIKHEMASKVVIDTIMLINNKDIKQIFDFLQRLFYLSLKNKNSSNAGDYYVVTSSNNKMRFSYWNSVYEDTYYAKMRNQLFGNIFKNQDKVIIDKMNYVIITEE